MTRRVSTYALAAVAFVLFAGAGTAQAGTLTTKNACLYSYNDEYRDQLVTLSGVGSPAGAPAGAVATLSGAKISAQLPTSLPRTGYELGLFTAGTNLIPSRVWVAIASSNAIPATQVRELAITATTKIVVDSGGNFVSGTPIVVTIPIPDTHWTVATNGPVRFRQAGPGTLPNLPVGLEDAVVPVTGSIVVKPKLGSLRFVLDCQPGSTVPPYTSITPAVAAPFASLEALQAIPPPAPKLHVASTKLRVSNGRVRMVIICPPGAAACRGAIGIRSTAKVRSAGKRRIVTVGRKATYDIPAGQQRTVRVKLTSAARKLMRKRAKLRVRVTLTPDSGLPARRILVLHRQGASR